MEQTEPSRQERIAAALVANGAAYRKPLRQTRCERTIELHAPGWGNVYVTAACDVRVGYTLRESQRVDARWRALNTGE